MRTLEIASTFSRRRFLAHTSLLLAIRRAGAAQGESVVAETSCGKVRGALAGDIKIFKGIPYGQSTAGTNRFKPPRKPDEWSGVRDALQYGPTAPQTAGGSPATAPIPEDEDCLVLNVFTPSVATGRRPVMVWLHGGGFSTGSGSNPRVDGTNLARTSDIVVVTINHRLNVLGSIYLEEIAGPEFALSGAVGMLDVVAALEWVRENISQFGGDPNLVTIFGQSGGGRKGSTVMSMPAAKRFFHRAIIQSGALLRLRTREDGIRDTELLLAELGIQRNKVRELQTVPVQRLLAANAAVQKKIRLREPGMVPNSPVVDGEVLPRHPWDPAAPEISATIPVLVGWTRTEETSYDRPTSGKLALDEAGLADRVANRVGSDPAPLIHAFRKSHPEATPWDLWILIATNHPRGAYARELAKRKVAQGGAPTYLYRFDWESPEGGGHMRSHHSVDVPFVFNNIDVAGPLISKMPEAHALARKVSASWAAFARTGNPNTPQLPKWPAYSAESRDTMTFNNECRIERDPHRDARLAMERVLKLS